MEAAKSSVVSAPQRALSPRKRAFLNNSEQMASTRNQWIARNSAYYADDRRYMQFLVREGARVLDLGCGTGELLAALKPSRGVGVDFSAAMVDVARRAHPTMEFVVGDVEDPAVIAGITGPFDYIIISDTIGMFEDIEEALKLLHALCHADTRIIISYFSSLWEPLIKLGTKLGQRMPQPQANLISTIDFENILDLSDLEPIRMEWRQLVPFHFWGVGRFINRFIAPLPGIRKLCLRNYVVARSKRAAPATVAPSTTIVIPCRNERGNIERAILEMPKFGGHQEIIFVEGNSKDNTFEECQRVQQAYAGQWDIKVMRQEGRGKGDAVRKGFDAASCDILMILDADLTVPPSALPKFHAAIASGKGEFINGTRLVYPMENEAMRFLNHIANRSFALMFSYLLNQRFTDTLCGTKVVRRPDYQRIVAGRSYFGDFDPFGDFDLIFGAAKQSMRIVEVPVHYKARTYGETQISRFRDGWLLIRMVMFAFKKLKAV
ncbi:MAG: glycosyltransferase [Hyphomicrobium sp.]